MKLSRLFLSLLAFGSFLTASLVHAQVGNDNPTGPTGVFNGEITTAGSYDPYTGNMTRAVTDVSVAGAVGTPLALTRIYNSRTGTSVYGCEGVWSHNYAWFPYSSAYSNFSSPPGPFSPTSYDIGFPDGRQLTFTPSSFDTYYRATPGTRERFIPLNPSTSLAYLILPDGTRVEFLGTEHIDQATKNRWIANYTYVVQAIIDRYGLRTTLSYNSPPIAGTVAQVTDPSGRYLKFYYTMVASLPTLDHVTASDGRTVQYSYSLSSAHYALLNSVQYYGDPTLTATYTYYDSGGVPLLKTCNDLMYAGPMKRIAYIYQTTNNADGTAPVYGQIQSENYYDGTNVGAALTTLTVKSSTQRIETRADGQTRIFNYVSGFLGNVRDFENVAAYQGFDSHSYVNAVVDRNGNQTNYTSNALSGALLTTTFPTTQNDTPPNTPAGVVTYTYGWTSCPDPNNRDANNPYYLYSVTDEGGHVTTFTRDSAKRVTQINYPDGGSESFTYNSFNQILTHVMKTGGTESFTYDSTGLKQTYRDPYHASGNPSAWYQYDSLGRVSGLTDALGSASGDIHHTTNQTYNSRGQPLVTTLPVDPIDGQRHTITNVYNPDGTLQSVTDELGHVTSYTYDDYRRLQTVTTPGHNTPLVTNVCYDEHYETYQCLADYRYTDSRVTKLILPSHLANYAYYDADRRQSSLVNGGVASDAATTSYGYDSNGNVTSIASPNEQSGGPYAGKSTVITYDERNRVMSLTDPLGNPTSCTYDAAGRKASVTRANGQVTTFDSYDKMNRLLQQTVKQTPDPDAVTKYSYYTSGLLKTMQDPRLVANNSYNYAYTYDTMGRETAITYPPDSTGTQRSESRHFDTAGRMDTFTNRAGSIETLTWDALNRLTNTSWNDGVTPGVTIHYDVANRPVNAANANATVAWAYFNDGLINTETLTALTDPARTVTYQYNADGLRSNVTYPGSAPTPAFSYSYTGRNQLDNISDSSSMQWVKYLYDLDGNRQHRKLNGAATDTVYGTADALDRILSISTTFNSGGTASFNYGFDAVSRLQYEQRNGGVADGYTYDLADQITGFNRGGTLQSGTVTGGAEIMSLTFDASGNRVSTTDNGVSKNYLVDMLNQYTQDAAGTPTYTINGNMASTGDGWAYTYDAQNRLTHADQSSNNTHVTYYYDPLNRQVARDENGVRTYSVWDGWGLIQEYDGNGNLLNNYLQGAGMDEMVARFGASNANRLWYYQDGRGNTSHVADDTGALVETYTYDLGGKPFYSTAAGKTSPKNRFLYNGRDYSLFTGLYDFRNRFYDPWSSRFIQSDPIGFAGGNHLYRFCGNSAVNGGDPLGLADPIYNADQPWPDQPVGDHSGNDPSDFETMGPEQASVTGGTWGQGDGPQYQPGDLIPAGGGSTDVSSSTQSTPQLDIQQAQVTDIVNTSSSSGGNVASGGISLDLGSRSDLSIGGGGVAGNLAERGDPQRSSTSILFSHRIPDFYQLTFLIPVPDPRLWWFGGQINISFNPSSGHFFFGAGLSASVPANAGFALTGNWVSNWTSKVALSPSAIDNAIMGLSINPGGSIWVAGGGSIPIGGGPFTFGIGFGTRGIGAGVTGTVRIYPFSLGD